jgi:uncharacterized protein YjbI with pentapeptide repeats
VRLNFFVRFLYGFRGIFYILDRNFIFPGFATLSLATLSFALLSLATLSFALLSLATLSLALLSLATLSLAHGILFGLTKATVFVSS